MFKFQDHRYHYLFHNCFKQSQIAPKVPALFKTNKRFQKNLDNTLDKMYN